MQIESLSEVKEYLDELFYRYNRADFIEHDPISVPHLFERDEDIEIAGFLSSTIAWGNRKMIVRNAHRMMNIMGQAPFEFVMNATDGDLDDLQGFVHRTFNHIDLRYFVLALRRIYLNHGGLGGFFGDRYLATGDLRVVFSEFYRLFFDDTATSRTTRHLSSIDKGAACKRLCMFLKWMVRRDGGGVDLGIWADRIPMSALYLPLDIHSGNTSRALGLLDRRANDWRSVEMVTSVLREFDPLDPVKYDFSLFCAGIDGLLPR
ncbi:MAG: TIGR02757 family protein [Rikenellaceae bacterium]